MRIIFGKKYFWHLNSLPKSIYLPFDLIFLSKYLNANSSYFFFTIFIKWVTFKIFISSKLISISNSLPYFIYILFFYILLYTNLNCGPIYPDWSCYYMFINRLSSSGFAMYFLQKLSPLDYSGLKENPPTMLYFGINRLFNTECQFHVTADFINIDFYALSRFLCYNLCAQKNLDCA